MSISKNRCNVCEKYKCICEEGEEVVSKKEDKNVCMTCKGSGVLNGGGLKPSVACSNCHGSGEYKYPKEEKKVCIRCHGASKDCPLCKGEGRGYTEEELSKGDMVNHPKHYTFGMIEVITVIDDWHLGFYEGQVVKYVGRAKYKGNELEDLKKAQWYLNRRIEQLEKEK
jgi:hypothetical protein